MSFSIIQKSQLEGASRIDAEYYQPDYLELKKRITKLDYINFGDAMDILTDYHANGSYEILKENVRISEESDFALMIRTVDLENDNFDKNVRYVSESAYNFLKKTQVFGGEIIVNKIGNAGFVYLMPKLGRKVSLGMNQFMIRLKSNFNSNYFYVFLTCKYGKKIIEQLVSGAVPQSIDKDSVRSIKIPIFSKDLQNEVDGLINRCNDFKKETFDLYKQAERILLEELGLKDYEKIESLSAIINLSEVEDSKRIDAEYFQAKYKIILEKIQKNNARKLGDLVSIKKGIEVGAEEYQEEGKIFIRVSSMTKFGIVESDQKYLNDKLYEKLKKDFEPKKGEILLTKDATPGIAYVLKHDIQGIISGGTLRLKLKDNEVEGEYLALCLNSFLGQMQAERDSGGSVIAHWKPEQIKNVLIPILPKETQEKISDLIKQSFEARKKSKELLEEAKRKVEYMIEKK